MAADLFVTSWIAACLPVAAGTNAATPQPNGSPNRSITTSQPSFPRHWAFEPPIRPQVPSTQSGSWGGNPIDAFIAFEHQKRGLVPSWEASRRTLIRRLSLDLIGLPPTPEEIRDFEADLRPDAYDLLVERLLASPHYGERWGRHWLDLARWAESDGYEANDVRSSAWRYRDYVVRSFNHDKPYDQFLREQIAGDEILPYSDEHLIATGFLAAGRFNNNEEDKAIQRNEALVDIVNATASIALGLTLNCAQCHDHKFDPLTAADYYRFQGFFVQGQNNALLLKDSALWKIYEAGIPPELETAKQLRRQIYEPARTRLVEAAKQNLPKEILAALETPEPRRSPEQQALTLKAAKELAVSKDKVEKALSEDDLKLFRELEKKITSIENRLYEAKPQTWGFYSPATSPTPVDALAARGMYPLPYNPQALKSAKPRLLLRGDVHRPADDLEPGWPAIFGAVPASFGGKTPRLALADWLASEGNPLAARVWVNFVWQQHFGRGLVATPGDFGVRGAKPSHAELLDWLATELVLSGWRTKPIHRLILGSATYRQGAGTQFANAKIDPDNQWLWRWPIRRLEAEAIRDAALAASGELDVALGGPSVAEDEEKRRPRRSIYLRQKRHELTSGQALFDMPSANESCPVRHVSTVALQPLFLMNGEFVLRCAEKLALCVVSRVGDDSRRQIEAAFQLTLGRLPEQNETDQAFQFLVRPPASAGSSDTSASSSTDKRPSRALVQFCQALLNLNEFIYIE